METKLINDDVMKGQPLCNCIKRWFQENGSLPFEHGFKSKTFVYKGKTYQPYYFNGYGISARNIRTREIAEIDWCDIPKQTIVKLVNECNRYYEYVMLKS